MVHEVQRRHGSIAAYHQPTSLEDALVLLDRLGKRGRAIAGGTDLMLELARGARTGIDALVDLTRVPELAGISEDGESLVIGSATTCSELLADERVVQHALPLVQACLELGAPQLRNRATLVGNLVTASPANDTISALLALGASVDIVGAGADPRRVALDDFITGFRHVELESGELISAIRVEKLGRRRGAFAKLGLRKAQAISIVHGAAVIELDADVVRDARITLGSVASTVVRSHEAERTVTGSRLGDADIAAAATAARQAVRPIDDIRGTAAYRAEQVEVLVRRILRTLRDGRERDQWPRRPALLFDAQASLEGAPARSEHHAGEMIESTVNGEAVVAAGDPDQTLLDWLRDGARLTGTKEGCAEGECGACTVVVDGQAVLACLVPAPRASGARITTVEGLAGSHPVQQAFTDCGAVQCGFCTPGFVVAAARLVDTCPRLDGEEIRRGLAGNLCRCTGYASIVEAVESVTTS